ITLMEHDLELPPQYAEYPDGPINRQIDPLAGSFSALQIGQSSQHDPIPRAGSSMSMRSVQSSQVAFQRQPRTATTLPVHNQAYNPTEIIPVEGAHSRYISAQDPGLPYTAYEDARNNFTSPDSIAFAPPSRGFQQSWQHSSSDYNPLYAAASNVLGMAPPPVPPSGSIRQNNFSPYPLHHPSLATSQTSLPSSQSTPFPAHTGLQSPYAASIASYPPSQASLISDHDPRPSIQRGETSNSVTPSTNKSKAVDLSAPPFTKEYIDQYRQRIKADPDPEAHFLYAKYLIDAAKHLRTNAKDQRAAKKYSEILIGESLKVIRRLATQGEAYAEAQFFLANCYGTGALGLQVDHERAYHLYLQAAKQNHAAASYRVAVCNEIGAGTRKEPPRAAAFYRKAASLGDTPAMYKLGMILLNALLGEQKNTREAINWLKRAAEQADTENPHALHELGLLHEVPNSALVLYDPAYARSLFTQAAQLGYTPSQFKLGQCYEYGTLSFPVEPRRSIAWYTKAAEKGDPEAELALSGWYLTGSEGVLKQSDSEAYLWARRAANKGLSKAEYAVGYYAEVGIGIKQDIEFAKRWYMRAAAQGNKRAMNRLTEMKRMGNKRTNVQRPTRQQAKDECVSLLEFLDVNQLNCLNEDTGHTLKSIIGHKGRNHSENYLESDADAQLLLNIPFNQTVKVRSIVIYASNMEQAPHTVKLAVNRPNLGFDDIEDAKETEVAQILELTEEDVKNGKAVSLRFVRFQAVNSLHIFVSGNRGDEETTRIDSIDILGYPVDDLALNAEQRAIPKIPTRLAKPVLPVLYTAYILSSVLFIPREGNSNRQAEALTGRSVSILTTLLLSLPTTSRRLRLSNIILNTLLLVAVVDYVVTPYLDTATDVVFTRVGAIYPDSVKVVIRYPLIEPSSQPPLLMYREVSKTAYSWKEGPDLEFRSDRDWVDTVRIASLWPSTAYEYSLFSSNKTMLDYPSTPIAFRTFPDPRLSNGSRFRFITSSCTTPNFPYRGPWYHQSIRGFDLLAEYLDSLPPERDAVDFMLFLGDFIYADVPLYVGDDKEAYRRLYRRNYNSNSFRKVYERLPIFHAYDDHEFVNNFGGSGNDSTPPYLNASDAFKLYNSNANFDPVSPGEHYYEFRYGDAAFFMMDTRRYRTELNAPRRTMLGAAQLASLHKWLSQVNTTVTFKFVGTSVPFTSLWGHDAQTDSWAGFPQEKQDLLAAFHSVPNVILLSGDRHEFAAIEFNSRNPELFPVWEFSTSPLSMFYIPFVRTLKMESADYTQRRKAKANGSEMVDYLHDVPLERVVKYLPIGNSKWSTFDIDSTDMANPKLKLETIIDGEVAFRHELVGTAIVRPSTSVGTYVVTGVKSILNKLKSNPSTWY
ncbi:hypothetical protein H0H93_003849, partial [Arthromyces matolae]